MHFFSIRHLLAASMCLAVSSSVAHAGTLNVATSTTSTGLAGWGAVFSSNTTENLNVTGSGTVLTVDSDWFNGTGSSQTNWDVASGAKILLTSSARINDNMPDLVNARPFFVSGQGTIEFQAGFNADHTGYVPGYTAAANVSHWGGDGSWQNIGFSTINLRDEVTMITHASQNLPSIHKLGFQIGEGNVNGPASETAHTHHGLITIDGTPSGNGPRWVVTGSDQFYDGGINATVDWTLETQTDLEFTGVYLPKAKVAFGSRGSQGFTLTKEGAAALILNGTQGYNPGSMIDIKEGSVVFHTNPNDNGPYYENTSDPANLEWAWPASNTEGTNLEVQVHSGASVAFHVVSELDALTVDGEIALTLGDADKANDYLVSTVNGFTQNGTLVIEDDGTMTAGIYDLFDGGLSGALVLDLPTGFLGVYDSTTGELSITSVPEPGSLIVLAIGAVALGRRRRA